MTFEFQVVFDPGIDDRRTERFGDVIDRAQFEPFHLIFDIAHGGDKEDRNLPRQRILLQLPADRVAIHFRHHDIQENQVG